MHTRTCAHARTHACIHPRTHTHPRKGDTPDLADISTYGVLQATEGLELHEEIVGRGDGRLRDWISAMEEVLSVK